MKAPLGFTFSGVRAGIKVKRPDLAIILSEVPAAAAGCFTRSTTRAPSVDWSDARVPTGAARAIVANSGNANALTGAAGVDANRAMADAVAQALGVPVDGILTCSTGVIGVPFPVARVTEAVPALIARLARDPARAAEAILTTDTTTKLATREIFLGGDRVRVLGIAKGSGMVHPNLATVLGFVLTDAAVTPGVLDAMLRDAVSASFNMVSIDRDTSTNDAVLAMANGLAENPLVDDPQTRDARTLAAAIAEVCVELARAVAADGEGARRLLTGRVTGAASRDEARALARAVVASNLVKAAFFGADPNWGRVLAAMGAGASEHGVSFEPVNVSLSLQGVRVFHQGAPAPYEADALRALLRGPEVLVEANIGAGPHDATAWGCDLSYDYVRINADYAAVLVAADESVRRDTSLDTKTPELKAEALLQALRYIERFSGTRAVIKLGGAALVRADLRDRFAEDVRLLSAVGLRPIVVHGGGPEITRTLQKFGGEETHVDGLRVTGEDELRVVEMVLDGRINGDIVAALSRAGARAVGLSGKDGNLIAAKKRIAPSGADLGYVGEVTQVNPEVLDLLVGQGYIPVISPMGLGADGSTYGLSSDAVAAEIAVACRAKKLIYLGNVPGILSGGMLVSELSAEELVARIQDGTISGGMLPRAQATLRALSGGVESVHVIDGRMPHNVVAELFTSRGVGTMVRAGAPRKGEEVPGVERS